MKTVYDESVQVSYGVFVCPQCKARFYGGGKPMHDAHCTFFGLWDNVELHFGPKQLAKLLAMANQPRKKWYGISYNDLQEHHPELAKRGKA